jgi:hypothetical protein
MPKIFGNSLGEYNKSCSAPHQESRKIEFAFSDVSTIFLRIFKIQQIEYTSEDTLLHRGPYKDLECYNHAPSLQNLRKRWGLAMWPLAMGAARLGQFRRGRRRSWPCRGAGRRVSSPRARGCSEFGRRGTRQRRTVVAGSDGRGVLWLRRQRAMPGNISDGACL